MADRGKTFSPAMVRALIAGRKTETRRLATKGAIAQAGAVGDRIYVREHWAVPKAYDDLPPHALGGEEDVRYLATGDVPRENAHSHFGRMRQAMHMPRWASRITLIITEIRQERLQDITSEEAVAEGIFPAPVSLYFDAEPRSRGWYSTDRGSQIVYEEACAAYAYLWNSLHAAEGTRWQDNPEVIVTKFRVVMGNIDNLIIDLGRFPRLTTADPSWMTSWLPEVPKPYNQAYQAVWDEMTPDERRWSFLFDVFVVVIVIAAVAFFT